MTSLARVFCLLSVGLLCGCNPHAAKPPATNKPPAANTEHAHADHGPNGGELIELGNEEYHAELLHDDKSVTIQILGSDAKKSVPIDATEVTINLTHDGKPEQFKLTAEPAQGDPQGQSSKFVSKDAELAKHIADEKAQVKLVVTIASKTYRGDIVHDHDHAGHEHK